jgi:hypothetical protein
VEGSWKQKVPKSQFCLPVRDLLLTHTKKSLAVSLGGWDGGGKTLAPGPKDNGLQYIDARDLAAVIVDGAEEHLGGVYNIVGKPHAQLL